MSYDVHLEADLGGPEPVSVGRLEANMTYNVAPMFREAVGTSPSDWDGMEAAKVAAICTAILHAFNLEPDRFKKLNPPNGWGDFEGARAFIQLILDACRAAPKSTVRVS